MQVAINSILAIAVVLFTTIVVVPAGFMLWKRQQTEEDEEFWDVLRAERALHKEEDSAKQQEVFLRSILKGHITQANKSKIRILWWCIFSFFWICFTIFYVYFSLDFSMNSPTFLDSFDPFVLGLQIFAILGGGFSTLYEKNKLRDINVLLDSFAEAHNIEGKVTIEKLATIKNLKISK